MFQDWLSYKMQITKTKYGRQYKDYKNQKNAMHTTQTKKQTKTNTDLPLKSSWSSSALKILAFHSYLEEGNKVIIA